MEISNFPNENHPKTKAMKPRKKAETAIISYRGRRKVRLSKPVANLGMSHQRPPYISRLDSMSEMEENSKSSPEQAGTPASGDETDVSPPSEQVTESGNFADQWIDTKCVFCLHELRDLNEPKLLNCLHTACKSCLSAESSPSPAPSSSGLGLSAKHLTCPSCSQEINPNDVVDHLFLLEHLSQNSDSLAEESRNYPCSCEEGADATGFCSDCQEWLCEACVTAHHRVRVTKDHIIRPKDEMEGEKAITGLSQKYLFCPLHSHEPLKLYCESCDKLTCRDCQLSDHKEHKYQFLTSACEEEKNSLNMILSKIKEKEQHIKTACDLVTRRHKEISQRENAVTQEVKTFAVKFITEINKRGKQLLQELSDVCAEKKTQLSYKNQELVNMSEKLKFCKKFSEAALAHGSETALVYSKKVIIGQLKRILKHRCEVPNPSHNVDITFSYEGNYLTQYISQLGTLLVDQQPVPRVSLSTTPSQAQQMTQPQQQQPQSAPQMQPAMNQPNRMQPAMNQNMQIMQMNRQSNQLMPASRSLADMQQMQQKQQMAMQQQKQQQFQRQQPNQMQLQQKHQLQKQSPQYGQPQVTSSTDPAQNRNIQPGNMRQIMNTNNQMATYMRNPGQRNMNSNVSQPQNQSYPVNNNNYVQQQQQPRQHATPQQSPVRQQPQQQQQQQPAFNQQQQQQQQVHLPAPLMHNSNITISPIAGPTPPKQRAITPRQNIQLSPLSKSGMQQQRMGSQQSMSQQPQARSNQPQVIEIDGDGPNQKTPNMSNTSRLSHFPASAAAAISALPGIQLQPINNNFHGNSGQVLVANYHADTQNSKADMGSSDFSSLMDFSTEAEVSLDQFTDGVIGRWTDDNQTENTNVAFCVADSTKNSISSDVSVHCDSTASSIVPMSSPASSTTLLASPAPSIASSTTLLASPAPSIASVSSHYSKAKESKTPVDCLSDTSSIDQLITREDIFGTEIRKAITVTAGGETTSITCRIKPPVDPNDDYCSVCKEGGKVLCCYSCPRVFHVQCHIPAVIEIPKGDFQCRLCEDVQALGATKKKTRRFGLHGQNLIFCERILLELQCHGQSQAFHLKIHKDTPNYYAIIKKPMDLSAISCRMRVKFECYHSVKEFLDDIRLIFSNCRTYNLKGSKVFQDAVAVEEFFEELLKEYFPEYAVTIEKEYIGNLGEKVNV